MRKGNQRLERIVADQALDIDMLGICHWKLVSPSQRRRAAHMLKEPSISCSGGRSRSSDRTARPSVTDRRTPTRRRASALSRATSPVAIRAAAVGGPSGPPAGVTPPRPQEGPAYLA